MDDRSPFSNKDLAEAIYDIRERIIRVEGRQERSDKVEAKSDLGYDIARSADSKADANAKDIESIRTLAKWAIATFIAFIGVLGTFLAVIL